MSTTPTRILARVVSVTEAERRAQLVTAALATDTTLFLDDAIDFNEGGGEASMLDENNNTELFLYTAADHDANTLTVPATLAFGWAVGDEVIPEPRIIERVAYCEPYDGELDAEVVGVRVPFWLRDRFPLGERTTDETVELMALAEGGYVISDVLGLDPVIDGDFIDPGTLPTQPTDGNPPSSSPTPSVVPGIGTMFVSWTPDALAPDPVTYEVHVGTSSGFTAGPATLAGETPGTLLAVRAIAGATLSYDIDYWVRIIEKDDDGAGPASSAVGPYRPSQAQLSDLAVGYLQAGGISVSDLLAGTLNAETLVASVLRTAASGRRVELDSHGIRLIDSVGGSETTLVDIPTDIDFPAQFNGELVAAVLTAIGAVEMRSPSNVLTKDATLKLLAGQGAPTAPPTLTQDVESVVATFRDDLGDLRGTWHDGTNLFAFYVDSAAGSYFNSVEKRSSDGLTVVATTTATAPTAAYELIGNMVKVGSFWFGLYYRNNDGVWRWVVHNTDGNGLPSTTVVSATWTEAKGWYFRAALAVDGTNIKVVQPNKTAAGGGDNKAWLGTYTTSGSSVPSFSTSVTTTETWNWGGNGTYSAWYGTADFGAARWVFKTGNGAIGVYSTTPTRQTAQEWSTASTFASMYYDGSGFREASQSLDVIYKLSNVFWGSTKYWAAFTWYDSAGTTHETPLSPRSSISMSNRRRLSVSWPSIPIGGADDPNAVRLYLKQNASDPGASFASYFRQGTSFTGTQTYLLSYSTSTAGSQDTAFAGGTGAVIKTALDDANIDPFQLQGDGTLLLPASVAASRPATPVERQVMFDLDANQPYYHDGLLWRAFGWPNFFRWAGFVEDFVGLPSQGHIAFTGGGVNNGTAVSTIATHPGRVITETGTSASGNGRFFGTGFLTDTQGGLIYFAAIVSPPSTASNATDRYDVKCGLYDNAVEANIVDGIYFFYQDNINSGNWQARVRDGGVLSSDPLDDNGGALAVNSNWWLLEFVVNAAGTQVDFYINRVLKGSIALSSVLNDIEVRGGIEKKAGTANRQCDWDLVAFQQEITAQRWT